jgi:DNA-binding NarL/FixJ family response regulator
MSAGGPGLPPSPIRVAIVEDDRATREGLAMLIGGTPGYARVRTFPSLEEALPALAREPADVVLLDIHLPGMSGAQGVRLLRDQSPGTQVLMLTVFTGQERVFESLSNGACGYLLKKTPPARLLEAIREVHEGGAPMSPEIARQVVATFRTAAPVEEPTVPLSPHEVRLLALLAKGDSYQQAGDKLGISVNTVRSYIRQIYDKLHVHSKAQAVSKALRSRIIS